MKIALDFEKKGKKLYSEAAANTKNAFVRKVFTYLSEQEDLHVNEIQEYISRHDIELEGDKPEDVLKFFKMTISEFKTKLDYTKSDTEAYEKGMELENNAYLFYKEQSELVEDEKVKEFLLFLMHQEQAHYELIEKSYDFIKDPEGFNALEEDWFFEG